MRERGTPIIWCEGEHPANVIDEHVEAISKDGTVDNPRDQVGQPVSEQGSGRDEAASPSGLGAP